MRYLLEMQFLFVFLRECEGTVREGDDARGLAMTDKEFGVCVSANL